MGVLRIRGSDGKFVGIPTLRGERGPQGPQGPKGDAGNIEELGSLTPDELDTLIDSGDNGTLTERVVQGRVIPRLWARIKAAFVRKVNGKSADGNGNVQLTASDVGARADNWMPTAAQVGARPASWTPTASDVGAVSKTGDKMSGKLTVPSLGIAGNQGATQNWIGVDETSGRYNFVEFAPNESKYEYFSLPAPATGLTANVRRNILTDKIPVTIAQGGTGATTAEGARSKLGITPANIGARPSTWTPTAAEVGALKRGSYERIEGTSAAKKNLNDYIAAGFYNVKTANTLNCPTGIGIDAVLLVYAWDNPNGYMCQELTETAASANCRRWLRHMKDTSGTWTDWVQVYTADSPPTRVVSEQSDQPNLYITPRVTSGGRSPSATAGDSATGETFDIYRESNRIKARHYKNGNPIIHELYDLKNPPTCAEIKAAEAVHTHTGLCTNGNLTFATKNNGTELYITTT